MSVAVGERVMSASTSGSGKADIMYLIDRLEALINGSRRVPLSSRVMIEEEEVLTLVEQMRQNVPAEIRQAKRVLQDREQLIKSAQAEADRITNMARERAQYMIDSDQISLMVRERGEQMLNDAQNDVEATRAEIEQYAVVILGQLEEQLQTQLSQIRNGLHELQNHRP